MTPTVAPQQIQKSKIEFEVLPTPQQLTAVNLRFGTAAKSLKSLAFSDLSAKALYLSQKPLGIKEIGKKVATLIGIHSVSKDFIKDGLEELKSDGRAFEQKGQWQLNTSYRDKIKGELEKNLSASADLIKKHFPKNIDEKQLAPWFDDALADFFIFNGDDWVQSICKGKKALPIGGAIITDEIVEGSIKKHKLDAYSNELKNSFRGFLASKELDDQKYLASIGSAMFSARLVAADVGADPITVDELRGSTFIADTNFLFALQLESKRFAASLKALAQALLFIDAKIVFIHETKEEYVRVWTGKRGELMHLVSVYPQSVIADVDDDFAATAVARGCKNKRDFETFLDSVQYPPTEMEKGPKITELDGKEIAEQIEKAKNDVNLKSSIKQWAIKLRIIGRPQKSNKALEHDASLIHVSEFEKKAGNKTYILTLDRSLQACCGERVGPHDIPQAICLEGLIQILAANNAGPGLDASNFAPLLTSIIAKRCIPPDHFYELEDLHWLYVIQKNVAKFRPEKIKEIVLEVKKSRLAGKSVRDKKLQLTVNRLYQEELQNTNEVVEEATARTQNAEAEAQKEKAERIKLQIELESVNKLAILRKNLRRALYWRVPTSIGLIALFTWLTSLALDTWLGLTTKDWILDAVLKVFEAGAIALGLLFSPIKSYYRDKRDLNK